MVLEASAGTGKTFSLTSLVARYVAEKNLRIDELLMVTFTKAAAAEMRERTRSKLNQALHALEKNLSDEEMGGDKNWLSPIALCDEEECAERIRRLRKAVSDIDSATITTIHGFFQQTLKEIGLKSSDIAAAEIVSGGSSIGRQIVRDELVRRYSAGDASLTLAKKDATPSDVETQILEVIRALDANTSAIPAPNAPSDISGANQWSSVISDIRTQINQQRISSGELSFDDLVTGMHNLISKHNPLSESVLVTLRSRYRLVLIDEFQDTDDVQWEIFSEIFDIEKLVNPLKPDDSDKPFLAMVMVGDPKQAIYRFRGADIAAYLRAVDDPKNLKFEMKRNFRSDADLINALNRLFGAPSGEHVRGSGFKFGNENIAYIQVEAGKKGPGRSLSITNHDDLSKPLQLRWISTDVKPTPTVDVVRPLIAEDLANHVTHLLNDGQFSQMKDGQLEQRDVKPGDICVLVRNHSDADPVVNALRDRRIPVVKSSVGSVTSSPAAEQIMLLLSALAAPNDSRRVKAFGLSWFIGFSPEDLLDEQKISRLADLCSDWSQSLLEVGIIGLYQYMRADPSVITVLSRSSEFERRLTDLEHLVELIHRETNGKPLPASSLLRSLEDLIASTDEVEENLRRIESDAQAVQVMTMHASKGLEFPIVLVPYPKAPNNRGTSVYTYEDKRFVDAAPGFEWTVDGLTQATREQISATETEGDDLRLMYVACTRARHQLVLWWANTKNISSSPIARLFFGDHDDLAIKTKVGNGEQQLARMNELVAHVGHDVAHLEEIPLTGVPVEVLRTQKPASLSPATVSMFPATARGRYHYRRWSFSTIANDLKDDHSSDSSKGGTDEGNSNVEELLQSEYTARISGSYPNDGLFPMPASSAFGTLVHSILERVDLSGPTLRNDLARSLDSFGMENLKGIDTDHLIHGLERSLRTPLGAFFSETSLAQIPTSDRLAEMDFHFKICPNNNMISTRTIAQVAASDPQSPFLTYFNSLAAIWSGDQNRLLQGLITGSIDATLRIGSGSSSQYFVVDYKTNKLKYKGDSHTHLAYERDNIIEAMEHHNYPLQALLYCVALHRFLSRRLPGYEIDRNLGGAGYLFLRGMVGPDTPIVNGQPNGVLGWRPSTETILLLDELLETGES